MSEAALTSHVCRFMTFKVPKLYHKLQQKIILDDFAKKQKATLNTFSYFYGKIWKHHCVQNI